jgi:hypothetical protein
MKQKYILGIVVISVIAVLGISLVAANGFGLGVGNKLGTLTDEQKEAAKANMDAIRNAIKDNDFEAWQDAMTAHIDMMKAQITEENFNQLVSNYNEMPQVKEQYGSAHIGKSHGMGNGMGQGKGMGFEGNCPMQDPEETAE